jgi:hypothetical protein
VTNARVCAIARAASKASSAAARKRAAAKASATKARARRHRPSGGVERQDDDRDRRQHIGGEFGRGDDHHRHGADEHEDIAQRDRRRRAEGRLELGGVGGQTRDQLAGLFDVEEAEVEAGQMGEDVAAQVGHDPLAERHDEVVAHAGGDRQRRDDADQAEKIEMDGAGMGVGKAVVGHHPHGDRHDQGRGRGDDQRAERAHHPAAVGEGVGQQRLQRVQRGAGRLGRRVGRGWHRSAGLRNGRHHRLIHHRAAKSTPHGARRRLCGAAPWIIEARN